jgi:site-specific recombinase XerD
MAAAKLVVLRPDALELARDEPEKLIQLALERSDEPFRHNTQRAYNWAWRKWTAWCDRLGRTDYVPVRARELLGLLEDLHRTRKLKRNSIELALSAISAIDVYARTTDDNHPIPIRKHPRVRRWMDRHLDEVRDQPLRRAPALLRPDMLTIVSCLLESADKPRKGLSAAEALFYARRDRALLNIGFLGGFRTATLAGLRVSDIVPDEHGLEINLRHSKTDQTGQGDTKFLYAHEIEALCPRLAWLAWCEHRAQRLGEPFAEARAFVGLKGVFLREQAIGDVIERRAIAAGLRGTGHSLRAGFATWAKLAGKSESDIQQHGGWKSASSMRNYFRRANARQQNPTKGI